jgi:superfamily I DNA/RNA helicase
MHTLVLNSAQRQAVEATGVVAVIAGPGTGKTLTLTARIVSLIQKQHVPPEQIFAATFTTKATHEIRSRVTAQLPADSPKPHITTLHAFCFAVLTEYYGQPPQIISESAQKKLVADIVRQNKTSLSAAALLKHIHRSKTDPVFEVGQEINKLIEEYEIRLTMHGYVDYEDLISQTLELFKTTNLLALYQERFLYIHVDEFQDLNRIQQQLIMLLASKNKSLFVIGDPDQSIYGFRGATPNGIQELSRVFPNLATITLKQNYRSSQSILALSFSLITAHESAYLKQPLQGLPQANTSISLIQANDAWQEAQHIVEKIQKLLGGLTRQNFDTNLVDSYEESNFNFADIAILLRNRSQGRFFKRYLLRSGIPFSLVSEQSFLDHPDIVTLRQALSTQTYSSLTSLSRVITDLAQNLNLDLNQQEIKQCIQEATQIETGDLAKDIPFFLQYLKILRQDEQLTIPHDKVTLMTIHAAKGLEFPVVFIPGLEEGILPSAAGGIDAQRLAEERRLLYVALTRAKQHLYLSYSRRRSTHKNNLSREPSRFLNELNPRLYTTQTLKSPKRKFQRQPKLF